MPQPLRAVSHTSDLASGGYLVPKPVERTTLTAFERGAAEAGHLRAILALTESSKDADVPTLRQACSQRIEALGYGRGGVE